MNLTGLHLCVETSGIIDLPGDTCIYWVVSYRL